MATSFKMKEIQNVPSESDKCGLNSMERDVECMDDLAKDGTGLLPQKLRSPPPKPPRRRHSDQLSVSSTGTFPSHRRKQDEENQPCRKEMQLKINSNKSGCGSLPANWSAGFYQNQTNEDTSVFKNSDTSSSFHLQNSLQNSSLLENLGVDNCKTGCNNTMKSSNKARNSEIRNKSNMQYFQYFMKFDSSFPKFQLESFDHQISVDEETEKMFSATEVAKRNRTRVLDLKSFQKEYHRRHHSDPVLSYFDKSVTKNSLPKSALRSHSFMGCTSEGINKYCDTIRTCSACKETHCLYEEIKILKEINDKLWQHLCSVQACLDNLKKNSPEETTTLSISDLLLNLYYAQKAKDCAMERRLKDTLDDRDAALLELEEMVQVLTRSIEGSDLLWEEKTSDKEIQELLQEIETTHNPSKLFRYQKLLLARIYHFKESRQFHLSHQLKVAIAERDNLMEKVKKLEEEMKSLRLCTDMWHLDNKLWESSLLDILCQVIQQRDSVLSETDSTQSLEYLNYRSAKLHKAHHSNQYGNSNYESLQKQDSNVSKKIFHPLNDGNMCSQFPVDMPAEEMKLLKREDIVLNRALEIEVAKREKAERRCLQLERLVHVLRKKLNGQNVGIPV